MGKAKGTGMVFYAKASTGAPLGHCSLVVPIEWVAGKAPLLSAVLHWERRLLAYGIKSQRGRASISAFPK